MIITPEIEARFWPKVMVRGKCDCWEWLAAVDKQGYGYFRVAKMEKAHRVAFVIQHGRMPNGLVCHTCDNPGCVNHNHLFEGTPSDNQRDCAAKGRHASGSPQRLDDEADDIRCRHGSGTSQRELAQEYGVSHVTIGHIVNHTKGYKNVS